MPILWFALGFVAFQIIVYAIVYSALNIYDWYRARHPIRTLSQPGGAYNSHCTTYDYSDRHSEQPVQHYISAPEPDTTSYDMPEHVQHDYDSQTELDETTRAGRAAGYYTMGQSYDGAMQAYAAASYTCDSAPDYTYCGGGGGFDGLGF